MATQFTWLIEQLGVSPQLDGHTDVVVIAAWRCNGVNEDHSVSAYGNTQFTIQQGQSFTPYDQLTEAQVLQWCYENGVDKTAIESAIEQQIQNEINPPIITPPLPWA